MAPEPSWRRRRLPAVSGRLEQALQDPAFLLGLLVAGQITAWSVAPVLVHTAPPLDVVEGYLWGREWVIATYKHPALPSWVLETSRLVTGAVGWPAYVVSQLFVCATFLFVFLLGREMMGPARAAAGTLVLTGVVYFMWPTVEFNHAIAEMALWAAMAWALWLAVERNGIPWWMLAGALAAASFYAKLTAALLLLTMAAWLVWDERARRCLVTPGPWIGLAVFAAGVWPLAAWLVAHDFPPLRYAAERTVVLSGENVVVFLLNLLINMSGMLAMLAVAGLIGPRRRALLPGAQMPAGGTACPPVAPRAVRYLVVVIAGPVLLTVVAALVSRSGLRPHWATAMLNLSGMLAIALTSHRFDRVALRRLAMCAAVPLAVVPSGYAVAVHLAPLRMGSPIRVSWPQAEMAERFNAIWRRETGRPLRIVTGDLWISGLVGLSARDVPSILSNGDFALSPWITPERIAREGMLIVWDERTRFIPNPLHQYVHKLPNREEQFTWKRARGRDDLWIGYVILPPAAPARDAPR
jgi:hypothetical protein